MRLKIDESTTKLIQQTFNNPPRYLQIIIQINKTTNNLSI